MKRILSFILCFVMVCGVFCVNSCSAAEEIKTYLNYSYTELDDGTVEIVGYSGKSSLMIIPSKIRMKRVSSIGDGAFKGNISIKTLKIPENVVNIGNYAFECCELMTKVTLPSTLRTVGTGAFSGCVKLESITVPEGVREFGDGSFYFCRRLKSFSFPKSVKKAGDYMFAECGCLSSVSFEEGLEAISDRMFWGCGQLSSAILPESVKTIGDLAFERCEMLSEVNIPSTVTSVGRYAFSGCGSLTSITFPAEIVRESTFLGCYSLENFTLTENVKAIEKHAFRGISLPTQFDIPASVSDIAYGAFAGANITGFNVAKENSNYVSVDGVILSKDMKKLIAFPCASPVQEYTTPSKVTTIAPYAFSGVYMLEKLTLGKNVRTIEDYAMYELCNLPEITIPSTVKSIGKHAFEHMSAEKIIILASVIEIPESCFKSSNTTSIILPNTVKTIGDHAFAGCGNIETLTLPKFVRNIGTAAFVGTHCDIVSKSPYFTFKEGVLYSDNGKKLVWYPENARSEFTVPNSVETICDYAMNCKYLKKLILPKSIKNVGKFGFGYQITCDWSDIETSPVVGMMVIGADDSNARAYAAKNDIGYFTAMPVQNISEIALSGNDTADFIIENANPEDVSYSSFDNNIASVDQNGRITAHKKGTAEIFASVGSTYFKCVVTVTSDGDSNVNAFDSSKYKDLTKKQVSAWLKNYMRVNKRNIVADPEANAFSGAYKSENYFEGIWAGQVDESEYDDVAEDMFGENFRAQMRMMGHGLTTELSRYEQPDDLVLYSGTADFTRFVGGTTIKELKSAIGTVITEPYFLSTALQESVTPTFAGPYCCVFIIYADKELIDGGYIEATVGRGDGGEYELLLNGDTRMEVIDAGVREIEVEDEWTGETNTINERYMKVRLI